MHDQGDVVGLITAVKAQSVAERGTGLVEIIAVIRADNDDGAIGQTVFFQCRQDLGHTDIDLTRAAIVERGNLPSIRVLQLVPLVFQIGAADEFIDIKIHRSFVFPLIGWIGKHAVVGFDRAVG